MSSDLISHLSVIKDPRADKNKLYPLEEILLLCICAVVSGADGWASIADFGRDKLDWLRQFLPYEHGIPSEDCLGWVMARLPAHTFQETFVAWTQAVAKIQDGNVVAIDGKRLRRSHDRRNGRAALHVVSAWANEQQLALGQVATTEKSNEITAIPELLRLLEIRGAIVTLDAMGCQTAIADQIVSQGADYILAVKDNQPTLHEALRDYFATAHADGFAGIPMTYDEETDTGHGRCEIRRCWLVEDLQTLPDPTQWAGLQSIVWVQAERHIGDQVSREDRYYITTLSGSAQAVSRAVRSHWSIENQLHWVLDVTFREDDSRIRRNHAPANFNTLRQFALNLLKRHPDRRSIKRKRLSAATNDEFRANIVFQQA
jgi:predicted transposase YbfD/YdcC